MISSVRGRVAHVDAETLIVEVGGVGLTIAVTPHVVRSTRAGDDILLHTNLIVREDALSLFGFETREELVVFTQLLGVTGVGPKSALGVLSTLTVSQIADSVSADDDAPFRRVSGIGPKTAKLIVVQLAGKLDSLRGGGNADSVGSSATAGGAPGHIAAQVTQALVGLGWSERTAIEAVASVADDASATDRESVSALLRLALALLGPARKESISG